MAVTQTAGRSDRVRVGLVGYGPGGSTFHAPFIETTPELDLVAVVTSDPGRRSLVQERHPDARVVGSVEELLARADLDVVVVTTPNATHVPLALRVLRSGRHVVVDKPVAPTTAQARALATAAAEHGRVCIPFHNRRWDGDFLTVRDLVTRGRLGPLLRVEIRWERWRPQPSSPGREWKDDPSPGAAGGVHYDLGPHVVDQAMLLLGRPSTVYAELATRRPQARAVDDAFLALTFPDGAVAHLTTSLTVGGPLPRFHVVGRDATYVGASTMDPQWGVALAEGRIPAGPSWGRVEESGWGTLQAGERSEVVATLPGDHGAFYRGVAETVLTGAPPPVALDEAVSGLQVLEAARRSADEGRVVRLPGRKDAD
ncbi:Gfo/Idh/MocA family oxidoreductase [Ornithinimicrobium sp. W1679]|uniref:Gfo/Idh/MocA family oxidoreductase n=1 Tax=Ornithinimicrobium sp. W1679 TaxID=3418770 RepID=UPI003CF53B9D